MTKRALLRIVLLAATLAVCAMIFLFSAQSGEETAETSGFVTTLLLRVAVPGFDDLPPESRQMYLERWGLPVRKLGHFSEFALLGALLLCDLALARRDRRWPRAFLPAWALATLYACTDEVHQLLVDGRGAAVTDVLIDSAGAMAGAALVLLGQCALSAHKRKARGNG